MTEREYKEYIKEYDNLVDDFNRIAKRLGVEPTRGDVPINMAFILKLLRAIERILDSQPCDDAVSRQAVKGQMIKYGFHASDMTVTEFVEDLPPVIPIQTCADSVSRQYLVDKIKELFEMGDCHCDKYSIIGTINQALPVTPVGSIPDNATNGDIMKIMFPNMKVGFLTEAQIGVYYIKNTHYATIFDLEWWNSPWREGEL